MNQSYRPALGALLLCALALGCGRSRSPAETRENERFLWATAGAMTLRSAARNPDSFVVEAALVMSDKVVCYHYRAQNGFGGMDRGRAVVTDSGLATDEQAGFEPVWEKECTNKSGDDKGRSVQSALARRR